MSFHIPYLPLEIISAIFEHHPDLKQVRECSLVCRAWVSPTRAHGFRRIHIRSGAHIDRLFLICEARESKWETLSNIKPREVVFTAVPEMGISWQAQRFAETFGDSVRTLRLEGRSWRCIPRETLEFIQQWFATTRVRRLEMMGCEFPSLDVYAAFVQSFKCLQAFESARTSYEYQNPRFGQPLIDMSEITDLDLGGKEWGHSEMFEIFVRCTAVRTLRIRPSTVLRNSVSTGEAAAIQRILRETGGCLEELDVDVQYSYFPDVVTALEERHLFTSLDLTMNSNLRKLRLAVRFGSRNVSPVRIDYVLPILKRLVEIPGPTGRGLEVLDLPFMIDYESLDWVALDRILQHPCLSNLKEVRCTGFVCCFTEKDCASGSDRSVPSPNSAPGKLARGLIETLQARLPRCRDRGILVIGITYQFLVTPTDKQQLERPKGYVNETGSVSGNAVDRGEIVTKRHKIQELALKIWNWGKRK